MWKGFALKLFRTTSTTITSKLKIKQQSLWVCQWQQLGLWRLPYNCSSSSILLEYAKSAATNDNRFLPYLPNKASFKCTPFFIPPCRVRCPFQDNEGWRIAEGLDWPDWVQSVVCQYVPPCTQPYVCALAKLVDPSCAAAVCPTVRFRISTRSKQPKKRTHDVSILGSFCKKEEEIDKHSLPNFSMRHQQQYSPHKCWQYHGKWCFGNFIPRVGIAKHPSPDWYKINFFCENP